MTNTATAQVNLNGKIKVGRKSFTIKDGIDHIVANNDTISLLVRDFGEAVFPLWKENGDLMLSMKAFVGGNKQTFGQWLATTDLASIDPSDRYNMMLVASEWKLVQSMLKSGELFKKNGDPLGLSSIQKKIVEKKGGSSKKKNSAGNTSKGKPKGSTATAAGNSPERVDEVIKNTVFETVVPKNEVEFAEQILDCVEVNNFNLKLVVKELLTLTAK